MSESLKTTLDVASVGVVVSTIATWLPPIAALLSIIWTTLRIVEMVTGKSIAEIWRRKP
jgi:hypothetical protein